MAAELHPTRNRKLDGQTVSAGSNRKLWWRCAAGHEWQARVSHRASGTGCPACRSEIVKYPADVVIAALRHDATRLARTPRQAEWKHRPPGQPGIVAVHARFGSWNAGLRAAGLPITHNERWSRESVLRALSNDAERLGRAPRQTECKRATQDRPSAAVVQRVFGSWNLGLVAAGLPVTSQPGKWTRDTVLAALRRREHELGRPPTASEMNAPGPGYPTLTIVLRKLGSWSEACGALGWSIQPSGSRGDQPVLAAIRVAGWELPGSLTEEAFETLARQRGLPTARTAINRFGSWSNAKRAASAAARGKVHVWSEDEIIAALHAANRELGRPRRASGRSRAATPRRQPMAGAPGRVDDKRRKTARQRDELTALG